MTNRRKRLTALATLLLPVLLLPSCGSFSMNARRSSERRSQSADPLDSSREIGLTLLRSTALATVRQPVTTTKVGFALAYQRIRTIFRSSVSLADFVDPPPPEIPGTPEFERLLDRKHIRHAEPGKATFRVDGPAFFSDFRKEVAQAKKTIDVQVFIFDNDDTAVHCADLLKARSNEVRVRVLFDDVGTTFAQTAPPETKGPQGFSPPGNIGEHLEDGSKVRVRRVLDPWLVSDHTKLLVFDAERAYLGGMNIGREYESEWHDLMARIEGPITVPLQLEFNRAWRKAGPVGDLALLKAPSWYRRTPPGNGPAFRILRTDPAEGRYDVLKATRLAINASRKRVWIENPYFAADDIADELIAAARRGVDVRVILPSRGDSTIMDAGNAATARDVMRAGVKVYRYPRMTHMKVMIADGWATFGSANLDTLSMRINRELNLSTNDPATVKSLENAVFTPDFRISPRMKKSDTDSMIAPLAESLADQL
ncbi:phosphatidylserine/phosphatidylglycerophosphate/cardiolipin synthase family protein [Luteolibacter ambystomatis]|uniref:Phosphatidylserine/phosphatidylglycerophosphate/ cardiolipin synthase family protein n=1 Tax=Luteolibacter ambystomatis TaxID=2824561 RepID=A0A975J0J1_9BACT|nr:phosphatidylserine/phosphatidylglycerophosphate/cardiolipin synthase family protein [Luteolibacter ambystomatis]QUE51784.1 phosphatidylserine/phosphatidylglycerophosphate/cardiolipin synthase family protein [Luteolibacter ambystomatis]